MNITNAISNFKNIESLGQSAKESGDSSFGSLLTNSISNVNDLLQRADKQAEDLAIGKSENVHEAMIAFEKAEAAMKLMVQVRNKAIEAYNSVIQMQV